MDALPTLDSFSDEEHACTISNPFQNYYTICHIQKQCCCAKYHAKGGNGGAIPQFVLTFLGSGIYDAEKGRWEKCPLKLCKTISPKYGCSSGSSKFDGINMYYIREKNDNLFDINAALFEFDQSLLGALLNPT